MNVRTLTITLALGTALAGAAVLTAQAQKAVPERDISLRRAPLSATTRAEGPVYPSHDPGEGKKKGARAFFGAPPTIPHTVAEMIVARDANDCLDCHEEGDQETPGVPPSHRIKALIRSVPRAKAKEAQVTTVTGFVRVKVVAGNRFDCTLCHVPQAENATLLVGNTFVPVTLKRPPKDTLKGLQARGDY